MPKAIAIIPARKASTRLPAKPLLDIGGKPMIRRVWERACLALGAEDVVIATDDQEIAAAARSFGARAVSTSPDCASGTDRVAEACRQLAAEGTDFELVLNVQGDEPFLEPEALTRLIELMVAEAGAGGAPMATLARAIEPGESADPSVVKVVCDLSGRALYFSRAPIGARRGIEGSCMARAHVGLYAYTSTFLQEFASLESTPLESAEKLEQLRALEHGFAIAVGHTEWRALSVDTPEDLMKARAIAADEAGWNRKEAD